MAKEDLPQQETEEEEKLPELVASELAFNMFSDNLQCPRSSTGDHQISLSAVCPASASTASVLPQSEVT